MNILFYHANAIQPTKGGISKITFVLGKLFEERGFVVHYVSAKPYSGEKCLNNQHFLEKDSELESLKEIIITNKIDVIINQFNFSSQTVDLLYQCKQKNSNVKIISCYHNSILTPIYNIAYQRELVLKKRKLNFLFKVLKLSVVNKLIVNFYIKKHRNDYRRVYCKSDKIVLLCDGQKEEFVKMSGIDDVSKLVVIYNTYFEQPHIMNYEERRNRVIWVGTFDFMVKRPDHMLKAWALIQDKYPDWDLCLLGDGPSLLYMKRFADKLNLKNVIFTGRVNPEKYYKTAKIHCITSTHECFPMVVLEAKAYSIPTIAYNTFTSAHDLVHDKEDGIVINDFDEKALADRLKFLMDNDSELRKLSLGAYKSLYAFSPAIVMNGWEELLDDMNLYYES